VTTWQEMREAKIASLLREYGEATEDEKTLRREYEEVCNRRAVVTWRLREAGMTGVELTTALGLSAARVSSLALRGREVLQMRREDESGG
jgi:hypothetical protein